MSKEKILNFFKTTCHKIGNFFKTNKAKIIRILKITGNVIFYAFILIVLLFSIANIRKDNTYKDDFPNLFGTGFLTVETNSMKGNYDNSFESGDLILVKKITDKNRGKVVANLKIGDIVTFYDVDLANADDGTYSTYLNTHRVVNIFVNEAGYVTIHTQGDLAAATGVVYNSSSSDLAEARILNETATYEEFFSTEIRGIYESQVDGAGTFMASLTEPYSVSFMLIIVLPILAFFIFEVIMVVKNIFAIRSEKNIGKLKADKEQMLAELDAQKEAMRKEILEQIKKEQEEKMLKKDDNEDLNNKDE